MRARSFISSANSPRRRAPSQLRSARACGRAVPLRFLWHQIPAPVWCLSFASFCSCSTSSKPIHCFPHCTGAAVLSPVRSVAPGLAFSCSEFACAPALQTRFCTTALPQAPFLGKHKTLCRSPGVQAGRQNKPRLCLNMYTNV